VVLLESQGEKLVNLFERKVPEQHLCEIYKRVEAGATLNDWIRASSSPWRRTVAAAKRPFTTTS
jgi:hypothetical protein